MKVQKQIEVRGVEFRLTGEEHASFSHGSGEHRRHYSRTNTLIDHRQTVFGEIEKGFFARLASNNHMLNVGNFVYPLVFQLPMYLLPSFQGRHGHIRYRAKLNIDIPFGIDCCAEGDINILPAPADLQMVMNHIAAPMIRKDEKNLYLCCFPRGSLQGTLTAPQSAFANQNTMINIQVDNPSDKVLNGISVELVARTVYTVDSSREVDSDLLLSYKIEGGNLREHQVGFVKTFAFPNANLATNLTNTIRTSLITRETKLVLRIMPPMSLDLTIENPIQFFYHPNPPMIKPS